MKKPKKEQGMPPVVVITPRQMDVFMFIVNYKQRNAGESPSLDQIACAIGVKSRSTVFLHLSKLEERKLIRRSESGRHLIVMDEVWHQPESIALVKTKEN
jgi:DNA-binding MarR family transcriptional regulator